ncbi:hypothetical protein FACS1894163_10080 [Spirochaetia bacterium]|nr:hypothetical protein FACS1894163_10080 [Spirochaetia bacterium]
MNTELKHISENLLTLRRRLKLSQRDFIQNYLSNPEGVPLISVSTFSNIENGSTIGIEALAENVAQKLNADTSVFLLDPDDFAKNIELFLGETLEVQRDRITVSRKVSSSEVLVQGVSDFLMEAVMRGEMRPGSKLPSDRELSARFGVGRTTLREALRVLGSLGIITILPGHGTYLASSNAGFHNSLSWTVLLSDNSVDHLIVVRNELEAVSARLAAENADRVSVGELGGIYQKMKAAFDEANFKDFLDLDLDFHLAIARCSQNPIIHDLLATSRKMLKFISKSGMVNLENLRDIYDEHGDIYNAIVDKDSKRSQEKMAFHLARARTRYHLLEVNGT